MQFRDFYEAVHGRSPRTWQEDLAAELWDKGVWSDVVSAPTGAGKTSVIDIAVWHLARQVMEGLERTAPLRIVLGVERRLIVDEAGAHARKVAEAVDTNPALVDVRAALRSLLPDYTPEDAPTILTTSMHGGTTWDNLWWRPVGCSIITGTMTQLVSRVLVRGVGESQGMRSISAGILGADAVRFCDEPHLMIPSVVALRDQQEQVENRPPQTVVLGATIPEILRAPATTFRATIDDNLRRWRPLRVVPCDGSAAQLTRELGNAAIEAHKDNGGEVVVIVSTTDLARRVSAHITKRGKIPTLQITSRVRPYDREAVGELPKKDKIVVATQTLEVGVDYDAKAIITDLAPLPSLVQRAGRAGRTGRPATVTVVTTDTPSKMRGHVAIYGEDVLLATHQHIVGLESLDDIDAQDARYADTWTDIPRMVHLGVKEADLLRDTAAEAPWSAYLRGPDHQDTATVTVLWRDEPDLAEYVFPARAESLDLPVAALKAALGGKGGGYAMSDLDSTGANVPGGAYLLPELEGRATILTVDPETSETLATPLTHLTDIEPGATVVLPTDFGMYSPDTGWDPDLLGHPVNDLSEHTRKESRHGTTTFTARSVYGEEALAKHAEGEEIIKLAAGERWQVGGRVIVRHNPRSRANRANVVHLADHLLQVADMAEETAIRAGSGFSAESYRMAGLYHDLGKANHVYQREVLGNPTPEEGEPWAKSGLESQRFLGRRNLPRPWRHESVVSHHLYREGHWEASILVADHHGKGHVHNLDGEVYQVTDHKDISPWDIARESAIFRWADWMASAAPRTSDSPKTLKDLGLDPAIGFPLLPHRQEPEEHTIVTLTGLVAQPASGIMAAYGAMAVALEQDPAALIRFTPAGPQIATTADIKWSPARFGKDVVVKKNHELFGEYPQFISQDYWPKDKKDKSYAASSLIPNNSNHFGEVLRKNVTTDVLFDPMAGWDEKTTSAGWDSTELTSLVRTYIPKFRPDVYAWMARGQLSWGAPQSPYGVGCTGRNMYLPRSSQWRNAEEVLAAARRGLGDMYVKTALNKYMICWRKVD